MNLAYNEMPKAIQNLVDGAEFLESVKRITVEGCGTVLYKFVFRDSFETWFRLYDKDGTKVAESAFFAAERDL